MAIPDKTLHRAFDVPLEPGNDAGVRTVGEYLKTLLIKVWREEEGFDGKRPFGNSSWQDEVYVALIKADLLEGRVDPDGFIDYFSYDAGEAFVAAMIEYLFR